MKHPLLVVPGWQNSEDAHWQSLWEKELYAQRVEQNEWNNPNRNEWVSCLATTVNAQPTPPVIIAHSLGCIAVAILSEMTACKVAGAFLVAPPDLTQKNTPSELVGFLPIPTRKLRFPSCLVASSNDPYCALEKAESFARDWGSQFHAIGAHGHINLASGLGPWPMGLELFDTFVRNL